MKGPLSSTVEEWVKPSDFEPGDAVSPQLGHRMKSPLGHVDFKLAKNFISK